MAIDADSLSKVHLDDVGKIDVRETLWDIFRHEVDAEFRAENNGMSLDELIVAQILAEARKQNGVTNA